MESGDRLVVKKVFVTSALKFGLIFGILFSIFSSVLFTFLIGLGAGVLNSYLTSLNYSLPLTFSMANYIITFLVCFIVIFLIVFILSVFGALLYNLVSLMGASLEVQLLEKGIDLRTTISKKSQDEGKAVKDETQVSAQKAYIPPKLLNSTQATEKA